MTGYVFSGEAMKYLLIVVYLFIFPLFGCTPYGEEAMLTKVKIVTVVSESAWWHCGADGYSIIELPTNERRQICGQYGNTGDIMMVFTKDL